MTLVRPDIRRGSDAAFKIYLADSNGRPYDLTGVTNYLVRLPKEHTGAVEVSSSPIAAIPAYAEIVVVETVPTQTSYQVRFDAVTPGSAGNDIQLEFDGSLTLEQVVNAWNAGNPSNQVELNVEDGAEDLVPEQQTVLLSQGMDSYAKVVPATPLQLGEISVSLSEQDTALMKLGKNLSIELVLDKGAHPAGTRKIVLLPDAVNCAERFF